jgi:cellulose synthase operon protein C
VPRLTHRSFRRVRWTVVVTATALAAIAVAAQRDLAGLALAAAIAAAGVAALVPELLAWLRERETAGEAHERTIEELLVRWPLTASTASPTEVGVPESKIANQYQRGGDRAPYVPRDHDDRLRQALAEHSFVLVVGPSKVGKSRTAFEVLRAQSSGLGQRPLLVPQRPSDNRQALRDLAELRSSLGLGPQRAVLWLDDVDEFLRAGALTATSLGRWRNEEPRTVVLATIREGALADLRALESQESTRAGATIGKAIGEVLDQANQVPLEAKLSADELQRAHQLYPDQDFRRGIGTRLIDAARLVDRLRTGRARCPEGVAVARAAADWRRAGITRRITREDLSALFKLYLEPAVASQVVLDRGLHWALEPLDSGAALLRTEGEGSSYEAYDYIVDFLEGRTLEGDQREVVPPRAWAEFIARVGTHDLVAVGYAAYTQPDAPLLDVAERAWSKATHSREPDAAALASFYLGALCTRTERLTEAEAAYRRAIGSDHPDAAPLAAVNLGVLLEGQAGRDSEAEAAYRQAIESGHPDAAPRAAAVLGLLLSGQPGREAEAEAAYRQAVDSGHAEAAEMAAKYLQRLIEFAGRRRSARTRPDR